MMLFFFLGGGKFIKIKSFKKFNCRRDVVRLLSNRFIQKFSVKAFSCRYSQSYTITLMGRKKNISIKLQIFFSNLFLVLIICNFKRICGFRVDCILFFFLFFFFNTIFAFVDCSFCLQNRFRGFFVFFFFRSVFYLLGY